MGFFSKLFGGGSDASVASTPTPEPTIAPAAEAAATPEAAPVEEATSEATPETAPAAEGEEEKAA